MKLLLFNIILWFVFSSCSKDEDFVPFEEDPVKEIVPVGWPTPVFNFNNNVLTADGFILGRSLFYDPLLSSNNTISCGTCHQQSAAYSQPGQDISLGINGLLGNRNAPALQNLNWNTSFLWDGGVNHIEVMPLFPLTNPVEMNETLPNIISKLSASSKYKQLFARAFGDETVNSQRIFRAITQFIGTLYSYNSKYDKVKLGTESFTAQEQSGYTIFIHNCSSCHTEPLFTNHQYKNIGLTVNTVLNDSGRAHVTGDPLDRYKFKIPSLRNVEKSSPYMHDGRYFTLIEVLNNHFTALGYSATTDPQILTGINLTSQDINDVVAFLKTLTDTKYLTDRRYSDPN